MTLRSTLPLTEMSTRNHPGSKGRPTRGADNLTAICEPIVQKMWEPRRLNPVGFHGLLHWQLYLFYPRAAESREKIPAKNKKVHRNISFIKFSPFLLKIL
jgi:hypothetical protein